MKNTLFQKFKDIKNLGVEDTECKSYTGYNLHHFKILVSKLESMRSTNQRTVSQAVAIFLCRFRNSHKFNVVATLFDPALDFDDCRRWYKDVAKAIERHIIPLELRANTR